MTRLVWFRNDLRVTDHPALAEYNAGPGQGDARSRGEAVEFGSAAGIHHEQAAPVLLPVYIFPPRFFSTTSFGFPKVGAHRAQFLIETVQDLQRALQQRGSDLIVAQGPPAAVLTALIRRFSVDEIWYQDEGGTEEAAEVAELQAAIAGLRKLGDRGGTGAVQAGTNQAGDRQVGGNSLTDGSTNPRPARARASATRARASATHAHAHARASATHAPGAPDSIGGGPLVQLRSHHRQTLYHPEDLPFTIAEMPLVYTDFRKAVEKGSSIRPVLTAPQPRDQLPPLPAPAAEITRTLRAEPETRHLTWDLPTVETLSGSPAPPADPRGAIQFTGGETAAWQRLNAYFWERDRLRSYKKTRNGLLGADYSSKLSPWLATGAISARSVVAEVRRYEAERVKNSSTYWLVFELIWRDYFAFLLRKFGKAMFRFEGPMKRHYRWADDWTRFTAWREGTTGQDFIDANMRELAATGYMSNRGRQNVASYLSRDLKVNWLMGAEYFESQLVDYDPASNYGNWSYTVGVGTDPRRDRYFNQEVQAAKYDPDARYRLHWLKGSA